MISNFLLKAIGELYHQAQDGKPIVFKSLLASYELLATELGNWDWT